MKVRFAARDGYAPPRRSPSWPSSSDNGSEEALARDRDLPESWLHVYRAEDVHIWRAPAGVPGRAPLGSGVLRRCGEAGRARRLVKPARPPRRAAPPPPTRAAQPPFGAFLTMNELALGRCHSSSIAGGGGVQLPGGLPSFLLPPPSSSRCRRRRSAYSVPRLSLAAGAGAAVTVALPPPRANSCEQ